MAKCRTVGLLRHATVSEIARRVHRHIMQADRLEVLLFVREGQACVAQSEARELVGRLYEEHPDWIVSMYGKATTVRDILDDLYDWVGR